MIYGKLRVPQMTMQPNPKEASTFLRWEGEPAMVFKDKDGAPVAAWFKNDRGGPWLQTDPDDMHDAAVLSKQDWFERFASWLRTAG